MPKISNKSIRTIVALGCFLLMLLAGCALNKSSSSIKMSYSKFDGVNTKDIDVDADISQLNLSGTIHMTEGKVRLYVNAKDTEKELYAQEFTAVDNGKITIDIDNLGENKNLVLGLEATHAKGLELYLTSSQTLIREPETPSHPDKDHF